MPFLYSDRRCVHLLFNDWWHESCTYHRCFPIVPHVCCHLQCHHLCLNPRRWTEVNVGHCAGWTALGIPQVRRNFYIVPGPIHSTSHKSNFRIIFFCLVSIQIQQRGTRGSRSSSAAASHISRCTHAIRHKSSDC